MGDNIHELTSLPYSNFQDEQDSDDGNDGHRHSEDGGESPSSIQVEIVTRAGRKSPSLLSKFNAMGKEKKITYILASLLALLSLFSIIYASVEKSRRPMKQHIAQCKSVEMYRRIDAGFGLINSRKACEAMDGCWDPTALATAPKCFYSFDSKRGYYITNNTASPSGMVIDLERKKESSNMLFKEASSVRCEISYETDSSIRVKIYNADDENRFEVPINNSQKASNGHKMQYTVDVTDDLFGFSVSRTHELQSTILNTTLDGLIVSDELLQIHMALSSSNVYGLSGDHKDGLLRKMEYNYQSLWSTSVEKRHGVHPFLLHVENHDHASGILLLNSNAMDVILNPYPAVTFRATGGILDFYIFLGPSPADVMAQFSNMVGKTFMPPLWALGYHLGSEAYANSSDIGAQEIVDNTDFPVDGIWMGRSSLKDSQELTLDTTKFPGISDVTDALHEAHKYFLVDTRPPIQENENYERYTAGIDSGIFVRDPGGNESIIVKAGTVGRAVMPDYFNPGAVTWLKEGIRDYIAKVDFDGLYLTENEPTTISAGSVDGCTQGHLDNPTYTLYNVPVLAKNTVCPSARHYGNFRHYDLHNIYGYKSAEVTSRALDEVFEELSGNRSLLLSRSTYIGSGVFTGHFIKENSATWADLKHSIVAMLNYNMYGIPLVGANICGYTEPAKEDATQADKESDAEELCVRWHQLATFYPFAKRLSKNSVDMFDFSEKSLESIRKAVELRYTLLPTLYTLFYRAHTQGTLIVSPLFFNHLPDPEVLEIGTQFMLGDSIMVAPVLEKGVTNHSVYFPDGIWYDHKNYNNVISEKGYQIQTVKLEEQTYYVKGGSVIIRSLNGGSNTYDVNTKGDYVLDVYLTAEGQGYGELFSDDGVTRNTIKNNQYLFAKFNATQGQLGSEVTLVYPGYNNTNKIQEIYVRGLNKAPDSVTVKGTTDAKFTFEDGVLCVKSLGLPVMEAFSIQYT